MTHVRIDAEALEALRQRVEAASGPDAELDGQMWLLLGWDAPVRNWAFTASVDSAISLVERCLPDSDIDLEIRPGMVNGRVHQSTDAIIYGHIHGPDEGKIWRGYGWTPALALLSALLSALSAREGEHG